MFTRKSRVQPKEILITSVNRLLQQNRHLRDHQPPATEGPLTEVLRKRVCLGPDRRY